MFLKETLMEDNMPVHEEKHKFEYKSKPIKFPLFWFFRTPAFPNKGLIWLCFDSRGNKMYETFNCESMTESKVVVTETLESEF